MWKVYYDYSLYKYDEIYFFNLFFEFWNHLPWCKEGTWWLCTKLFLLCLVWVALQKLNFQQQQTYLLPGPKPKNSGHKLVWSKGQVCIILSKTLVSQLSFLPYKGCQKLFNAIEQYNFQRILYEQMYLIIIYFNKTSSSYFTTSTM